jgi:isoaspartyl peptidase/L-asparaginase-like protein (Ntn-hydrolase superfamily)
MYGRITSTPAVGAGAYSAAINQNFGATFGGNPIVLLVVQKNTWTAVAAYFHAGVDAVSTTAFSWSVRNTAGGTTAAANSYYINWFAIGQY